MVPFWCLFSSGADRGAPARGEGEGDWEAFRSWGEGEGVDAGFLSRGDRAGLGHPFREDGDVVERGVDASALTRPFSSFSPERWDGEGAKDGGLREEGEEVLRRRWGAESDCFRQGIFSRLTTGRDTLKRTRGLKQGNKEALEKRLHPPGFAPRSLWWVDGERRLAEARVRVVFGHPEGQRVPGTGGHRRGLGLHGDEGAPGRDRGDVALLWKRKK